jgi:putative inorganic carbon (hco3(-)) transporter
LNKNLERAAFYLTCGSAIAILFSIATSQILMALALAALLISGQPLRFPPIKLPLLLFIGGTMISWLASGHIREGTPQIRKFFVFAMLFLVASTFRSLVECRTLVLLWTAVASLSALRSLFQFLKIYRDSAEQHQNFYQFYVGSRITGFMSHWMTFGGEEMIVLLMLVAFLLFADGRKWKLTGWLCAGLLGVSLILGFTRSIFLLGVPTGLLYLLWFWRRWLLALVPVVAVLAFFAAPSSVRERVTSIFQPHGETDSNEHRAITFRTGLEMIRAHPLLGLGPEQVKAQFQQYVPEDVPRPLPEGWYGHLHNIYLQYAAERGIPTALFLFWMIGKILYDFARGVRTRPDARYILHGAIAVVLAILAEGFFEYNLGDSEPLTMFLAAVGMGYVAIERA